MPENNNMAIWEPFFNTDPKYTKRVKFGAREFTTIDAMYQCQEMTRHFGPVGRGWGWDASLLFQDGACVAKIVLWWMDGEARREVGPIFGCKRWLGKKGADEDAPKKAVTDGLTKAMSYLGHNADVFLGKFDDNKYVAQMNAKYGNNEGSGHDGAPETDMDHNGDMYPDDDSF